jgi:hypothetical protein
MNRIMVSQHSGARMRQQMILVAVGILVAVIILFTRSGKTVDKSESGFDQVSKADEEDFENTRTGNINTLHLSEQPADAFGDIPTYDPRKSDLIIHVGPLKSGTEEFRRDISKYTKNLKADDYTMLKGMDGFHEACQQELSSIREKYSLLSDKKLKKMKSFDATIRELSCWKSVLDTLQPYRATSRSVTSSNSSISSIMDTKKKSVIVCDEQLAKQFLPDVYQIGPSAMEWITIRDTIMNDFNIVIVVSYLRYYEWLPSAKAASEQYHIVQHTSSVPRLARWPGDMEHGMLLEPLFPHFVTNAKQKIDIPYTDRMVDLYRPYVSKVEVLNLHIGDQSITTTFLCNVLNSATTACAASRKDDFVLLDGNPSILKNPTAVTFNTTSDKKWYNFQLYDELVTTAAKRGVIRNRRVSRTTATVTTQYYVEQYLKLGEARQALPLTCPDPESLRHFLDQSLAYERTVAGKEFAQLNVQQHKEEFQKLVDHKMFCSINMRAVLREYNWRMFFRHLSNDSAPRTQAGGKPFPTRRLRA